MHRIRAGLERFFEWCNAFASLWIFALMLLVTGDVIGRELSGVASWLAGGKTINLAIRGTPEIVKLSIVGIVFLQVAHALRKGRHVRSTVLVSRVPPRAAEALTFMAHLLGAVLCALIIWSSWGNTITAWQIGEYEGEGALRVPVAPSRTLIIIGSAMFGLQFLILALENVARFKQLTVRRKGD
jgi:TRAP-type C4-dicarboxylate transport system permease small subunit